MARSISTEMQTELDAAVIRPIVFVFLDFASEPVRMWNGIGTIERDGQSWDGVGDLMDLGGFEEASDGTATNMVSTLAGVPGNLTASVYEDDWQGRDAIAWLGAIDGNGAIVEEPVQIRQGIMDSLGDTDDGSSATFALTVETPALDQGNNRAWRLTDAIQQSFFPGDKGLEFVNALQAAPIRWGATTAQVLQIKSLLGSAL